MNKLSRKDIQLLRTLANTPEKENKLSEYLTAKERSDKLWKEFREAVTSKEEVKPQVKERKFKKGDKVRVVKAEFPDARTRMVVGDVSEVLGYKDNGWVNPENRPVIVSDKMGGNAFFQEHALELVEEKSPNELRAKVIQKAKKCVEEWLTPNTIIDEWNDRGAIACPENGAIPYGVIPYLTVDKEKRTVHFVGKGALSKKIRVRTKAVCHPNDVFNEHIGKAIALGRALEKDVSEFENAVQPDKSVIGTISRQAFDHINGFTGDSVIWDDTNAQY